MPHQPTVTEARLENLTAWLTPAISILSSLHDTFAPPFVQPISNTIGSLVNLVQNVKQNKKECAQLVENILQVLYAIIDLHIKSEVPGSLSPVMMDHVGAFMETLQKICIYIEAQQDKNKFKQLFYNNKMNNLLKDCHTGLNQALEIFEINTGLTMLHAIDQIEKAAETMHKELLELISTISETNTISDKSSMYLGAHESQIR
ncbi:hypothetical protein B0H12DRAFT_1241504 [Mycena haematopus]|nr:hypothetical protein B0H12DRAFT_1241504 [Mycena haematopus]